MTRRFPLLLAAVLALLAPAPAAMAGQGDPQTLDQIDAQTYQLFSSVGADTVVVEPGPGNTFIFHTNFTITLAAAPGGQLPGCTLSDNNTDATCPSGGITWIAVIGNGGGDTLTMQAPGAGEPNARVFLKGDGDDGADAADTITGGTADDWLQGGPGVDNLHGGAGDDDLNGGDGNDHLFGQAGQDEILGGFSSDTGGDEINGGSESDVLDGGSGVDTITGEGGGDTISGGPGNDDISAGTGNDEVTPGPGSDVVDGGGDIDTVMYNEFGRMAGVMVDLASASAGNGDPLEQLTDFEHVTGTSFDDTLRGTEGANTLNGLAGGDTLEGRGGPDMLSGNLGEDTLSGGQGSDQLYGGADGDVLDGGGGTDLEVGESGDDVFLASAGNDVLLGGVDRDTADYSARGAGQTITLDGSQGKNDGDASDDDGAGPVAPADGITDVEVVKTGGGGDTLATAEEAGVTFESGGGADTLTGGGAADVLRGGAGIDTLTGAGASDRFEGGAEADTYNAADGVVDTLVCEGADVLNADAADVREGCAAPVQPTPTPTASPSPTATPVPTATPGPGQQLLPMPARVTAKFRPGRRTAGVTKFVVSGLPGGGKATVRCSGKRCPFRTVGGRTNFLRSFKKRALRVGTVLRVTLTAPGHETLVVRFTVKRSKVVRAAG
jgi:Ca2+-binding RTX toxin-like protein